jgi:hypothetical protein
MKRAAVLAMCLSSVLWSRAEIQFKGLTTTARGTKFSLYSTEDQTSKWVSVGESFAGYSVDRFSGGEDVLVLKSGERVLELRIEQASIPIDNSIAVDAAIKELTATFGEGFVVHGTVSVQEGVMTIKDEPLVRLPKGQSIAADWITINLSTRIMKAENARMPLRSEDGRESILRAGSYIAFFPPPATPPKQ